jgi:hypothetical protein
MMGMMMEGAPMLKTTLVLLPILILGLIPVSYAHSQAYLFGYKIGLLDGKSGIADDSTCHDIYNNSTNWKIETIVY